MSHQASHDSANASSMAAPKAPRKTPLYERHVALGGRIIDFGGWALPVQYSSIIDEHKAVRSAVGLFDVSHMGEVEFVGSGALDAVERLVSNDVRKLVDGQARYTVVCYPDGGIVDDCIVYREHAERILIVINAANVEKDVAWFREHTKDSPNCTIRDLSDELALIAVQGPKAVALVDKLAPDAGFAAVKSFFASSALPRAYATSEVAAGTKEPGLVTLVPPMRARSSTPVLIGVAVLLLVVPTTSSAAAPTEGSHWARGISASARAAAMRACAATICGWCDLA